MLKTKAFSPCHITGFFQIVDQSTDPLYVGSRGAGVSLRLGVETSVNVRKAMKNSVEVKVNGSSSDSAEVSNHVLDAFISRFDRKECFEIIVDHTIEVPIGAGFGTSGAAALSLAIALNKALDLNLPRIEAAQIAHVAEVECKTGLGTVIAESFGGIEIRIKPGAPGIGEIRQVSVPKDHLVACLTLNSLHTKQFLTDYMTRKRINKFGGTLVDRLAQEPNLNNFLKFSRQFAEEVGLITENLKRILREADTANLVCSMPIFGESIFTIVKKESLEEVIKIFRKHGSEDRIIVSKIDFEGARLVR